MRDEETAVPVTKGRSPAGNGPGLLRLRTMGPVIRAAGLVSWTIVFALLYLASATVVAVSEPDIGGFGNAAWLMFQAVTTIGFGDFTCTSIAGRIATVMLSAYSVIFLAPLTGAIVSFCPESMRARRNESIAHFIDQLEHLPELSPDELAALSAKVKDFNRRRR